MDDALVALLVRAHAGERSAALAYRGHAAAVSDPRVARRIRAIARDEWHHRRILRGLLRGLGGRPSRAQERARGWLGVVLGTLCAFTGEWLPAVVAARLERRGAAEYERAAAMGERTGRPALARTLRALGRVEARHARYFAALAARAIASYADPRGG